MADGPHLQSIDQRDVSPCRRPCLIQGRAIQRLQVLFEASGGANARESVSTIQVEIQHWQHCPRSDYLGFKRRGCVLCCAANPMYRTSTRAANHDEYGSVVDDPHLQSVRVDTRQILQKMPVRFRPEP
jgi:hypothetical protein